MQARGIDPRDTALADLIEHFKHLEQFLKPHFPMLPTLPESVAKNPFL